MKLILFPGLGADARMFEPQRALSLPIEIPARLPALPREPFPIYAKRVADCITPNGEIYLGGVSFGGMLALEVARHLPQTRGVILISSCRSSRNLPLPARLAGPLTPAIPASALAMSKSAMAFAGSLFGARTPEHVKLLKDMVRDTPAPFLKWSMHTAATWPGVPTLSVPIHHIHGSSDRVIPCPRENVDEVVPGAGHLLNMTHPDAVNRFITNCIN